MRALVLAADTAVALRVRILPRRAATSTTKDTSSTADISITTGVSAAASVSDPARITASMTTDATTAIPTITILTAVIRPRTDVCQHHSMISSARIRTPGGRVPNVRAICGALLFAHLVLHRHMLLRRAPISSGTLIGFAEGFGADAATGRGGNTIWRSMAPRPCSGSATGCNAPNGQSAVAAPGQTAAGLKQAALGGRTNRVAPAQRPSARSRQGVITRRGQCSSSA
jgi:hypothetical protein